MKKFTFIVFFCFGVLLSFAGPLNYGNVLVVETFDSAAQATSKWWVFDNLKRDFVSAKDKNSRSYLKLSGTAADYYVGGMGTYLGKDATPYNALVIDVLGSGEDSGRLRIQLYDDDNNTYQMEMDGNNNPLYDDLFEYDLLVDWEGWRTVEIPFNDFVLVNPGVGDGRWNPGTLNGSGGLLQIQFLAIANSQYGSLNIGVRNLLLAEIDKLKAKKK